jgi:hypothetical protein
MIVERKEEEFVKTMNVPIEMNRASIGDAQNTFAIIKGESGIVAWVPRDRITISEQKITGNTFVGQLSVDIINEEEEEFEVETMYDVGEKMTFWVNRKTGMVTRGGKKIIRYV